MSRERPIIILATNVVRRVSLTLTTLWIERKKEGFVMKTVFPFYIRSGGIREVHRRKGSEF